MSTVIKAVLFGIAVCMGFGPTASAASLRAQTGCTVSADTASRRALDFSLAFSKKPMIRPDRGDLLMIQSRERGTVNDCVFRVIGLGGEEVSIRDGQIFVNGRPLTRRVVESARVTTPEGLNREMQTIIEGSPEDGEWAVFDFASPSLRDQQPMTVPKGSVLVIEDIRTKGLSALRIIDLDEATGSLPSTTISSR